jgi:hypothetical protein
VNVRQDLGQPAAPVDDEFLLDDAMTKAAALGSNLRLASFRAFRKRIAERLRRFRGGRGRQGVV